MASAGLRLADLERHHTGVILEAVVVGRFNNPILCGAVAMDRGIEGVCA